MDGFVHKLFHVGHCIYKQGCVCQQLVVQTAAPGFGLDDEPIDPLTTSAVFLSPSFSVTLVSLYSEDIAVFWKKWHLYYIRLRPRLVVTK